MMFSTVGWAGHGSASADEVPQWNIQGKWSWILKDKSGSTTGTVDFVQIANVLTGMFTVDNSGAYVLDGTIDGIKVKLAIAVGEETITFQGLVNTEGNIMAGAKSSGGKTGTWQATRSNAIIQ
jgi:hypothetical protein